MLASGQVVALAVGAVATIVLARALKPAGFGTYSVIGVAVSLGTLVAIFGLDTHLITELEGRAADRESDRRSYATVFRLSAEITVVLCIPATALIVTTTRGAIRAASLFAVVELLITPYLLGRSVLMARMQQGRLAAIGVANRLALFAGVLVIALLHVTPALVWMMAVSTLAVAVEALLLVAAAGRPVGWLHRLRSRRTELLAVCWPLAAAGIAGVAYNRLDQLILAALRGPTEVGTYAVAVNLATLLSIISSVVYATTLPGLVEICRDTHDAPARAVVKDISLLMFLPGGLGIAILAGAGGWITQLLFGDAYRGDHALVAVLAIAELWVFAGTVVAAVLIAVNRRRALLRATAAGLAIDVVLCLALLPTYGAIAAAWASFASYGAAALVAALPVAEARRVARPLVGVTVKTGIAASVGAAAGAAMPALAPAVVASSVAYACSGALLFHKELARAGRQLIHVRRLQRS
jgi:O-antigen/teichoic acid export membrane protein